jgi:hypothetical protein
MILLRWVLFPLYLVNVWCIYRLTAVLYSHRIAPWFALLAAILARFFYTSTEFRTDQLWTAFWLLSLVVAVSGKFTLRRAFGFALLLGLSGAVSIKTVPLVVSLGSSVIVAMAIALIRGERPGIGPTVARLAIIAIGMAIPPIAVALYFVWRDAFWLMWYCVIQHNLVPGLKRWGKFSLHQWYYAISVPCLAAYAWLIFHQTPDRRLAIRRTAILLTPWFFFFLLLSYWPDITREDDLPYVPLIPLSLIPLALLGANWVRGERWRQGILNYGLPALVLWEFVITFQTHNIVEDRMRITTHNIGDILELTRPNEYVMDDKGDYVFRPRPYYWVLEPITKARIRMGYIHDSIPLRLTEYDTKICSLQIGRPGSVAAQFILANYIPFDNETRDMGVLGKVIGDAVTGGNFSFDVTIPQYYAVVSETGQTGGQLDGQPYTGPVWLGAGKHQFTRTSGGGRVAIFLKDASEKGFSPLFDLDRQLIKNLGSVPKDKKNQELQ